MDRTRSIRAAGAELPCPRSYHHPRTDGDTQSKKHHMQINQTNNIIHIDAAVHVNRTRQSHNAQLILSAFLSASSGTFNSLFKVLFIFPSRYLFTIEFKPLLSLSWNLPAILHSNPEERDSWKECGVRGGANGKRDSHPQWFAFPSGLHLCPR